MQDYQIRDKIHPGQKVMIVAKENGEYKETLIDGIVEEVLTTTSEHYRGIKVRLKDGTVGRVQQIYKK